MQCNILFISLIIFLINLHFIVHFVYFSYVKLSKTSETRVIFAVFRRCGTVKKAFIFQYFLSLSPVFSDGFLWYFYFSEKMYIKKQGRAFMLCPRKVFPKIIRHFFRFCTVRACLPVSAALQGALSRRSQTPRSMYRLLP